MVSLLEQLRRSFVRNRQNRLPDAVVNSYDHHGNTQFKDSVAASILQHDNINEQKQSELFNRLPAEIRDLVWQYALLVYSDPINSYHETQRYCRPGQDGIPRIALDLLLTCRAIYCETFELPLRLNALTYYDGDPKDLRPKFLLGFDALEKLAPWQLAILNTVDLRLQQCKLENDSLGVVANWLRKTDELKRRSPEHRPSGAMNVDSINDTAPENITHLIIRLGRTDWWTWEHPASFPPVDQQLALDPALGWIQYYRRPTKPQMLQEAEHRRLGEHHEYTYRSGWGSQVSKFRHLRTLELILETFRVKKTQLDAVVDCAKTWKFPMQHGYELRFSTVEVSQWQGVNGYGYELGSPLGSPPIHPMYTNFLLIDTQDAARTFNDWSNFEVRRVIYRLYPIEVNDGC